MTDTIAAGTHLAAPADASLRHALLDSRQRWRDLVLTAADLAYETDAWGRFVFVMPDPALGWSVATLIDQPAELLLAGGTGANGFNPFRVTTPVRRRRAWLQRADGSPVMLAVSAAPLRRCRRAHRRDARHGRRLDRVRRRFGRSWRHRCAAARCWIISCGAWVPEVLAPRMMQAALDALMNAIGAEGAAVIDVRRRSRRRCWCTAPAAAPTKCWPRRPRCSRRRTARRVPFAKDGRPILVAVCRTRFGANAGIALWRSPGSRGWDSEDKLLIGASASLIRMVLEHEAIQHEMARQATTDPLTGLLNRRAFLEEMARHIDRLDREEQPGTLLFADLDYFKPVNDRLGHEVGDQVLVRTADILRNTVRPSDLVARLGGDEFALWLNGADHMTAAERADRLCTECRANLARDRRRRRTGTDCRSASLTREAGSHEPVDSLLRRADHAMYEVKRTGRGHWRVASEERGVTRGHPSAPTERHACPPGAGAGTEADVLVELADDPSVTVRAALALNTAAPAQANDVLARDRDERVRILLARKLAALVRPVAGGSGTAVSQRPGIR